MKARTSAPANSGARRASSSRPACSSCSTFPQVRTQVRPERGRGAGPAEQHAHGPVPQQVYVIDGADAPGQARHQAAHLQRRVYRAPARATAGAIWCSAKSRSRLEEVSLTWVFAVAT